jgi:pimeloyl-ACP methyl ester carboxylesterase
MSHGGALSIDYTARHPERVSHLILYGSSALGRAKTEVSMSDLEELNAMLTLTRVGWGTGNPAYQQLFTSMFMPDGKAEEMRWFSELQKKSTSPENAVRFIQEFVQIDVQGQLSKIGVPTLVIHSRGDLVLPFQHGRELAARIKNAHFVQLNSRNHILTEDEEAWKEFLTETRRFLGIGDDDTRNILDKDPGKELGISGWLKGPK